MTINAIANISAINSRDSPVGNSGIEGSAVDKVGTVGLNDWEMLDVGVSVGADGVDVEVGKGMFRSGVALGFGSVSNGNRVNDDAGTETPT